MTSRPTCSWKCHDRIDSNNSDCPVQRFQSAFSLLEVIIATAVLAGSAMVLFSLLSLGSNFGRVAQERTLALASASSLLEELVATQRLDPSVTEITGIIGSNDPLGYRVRLSPYRPQSKQSTEFIVGLSQVTVELFESEVGVGEQRPICSLTRIIRLPAKDRDSARIDNSQAGRIPNGS